MARYIILICFFILFGFQNICNAQCYTKCYGNKQYQNDSMQIKKFSAQKKWEVENVLMYQTPLIMDVLNDDGIPEIIVGGTNNRNLTEPLNDEIFIINSTTKMIERKIKTIQRTRPGTTHRRFNMQRGIDEEIGIVVGGSRHMINPHHHEICHAPERVRGAFEISGRAGRNEPHRV